jgi:hypothetical protein
LVLLLVLLGLSVLVRLTGLLALGLLPGLLALGLLRGLLTSLLTLALLAPHGGPLLLPLDVLQQCLPGLAQRLPGLVGVIGVERLLDAVERRLQLPLVVLVDHGVELAEDLLDPVGFLVLQRLPHFLQLLAHHPALVRADDHDHAVGRPHPTHLVAGLAHLLPVLAVLLAGLPVLLVLAVLLPRLTELLLPLPVLLARLPVLLTILLLAGLAELLLPLPVLLTELLAALPLLPAILRPALPVRLTELLLLPRLRVGAVGLAGLAELLLTAVPLLLAERLPARLRKLRLPLQVLLAELLLPLPVLVALPVTLTELLLLLLAPPVLVLLAELLAALPVLVALPVTLAELLLLLLAPPVLVLLAEQRLSLNLLLARHIALRLALAEVLATLAKLLLAHLALLLTGLLRDRAGVQRGHADARQESDERRSDHPLFHRDPLCSMKRSGRPLATRWAASADNDRATPPKDA